MLSAGEVACSREQQKELSEINLARPAAERLDANGPGSSIKINPHTVRQTVYGGKHIEQRFAQAVAGGTQIGPQPRLQRPAAILSGDMRISGPPL